MSKPYRFGRAEVRPDDRLLLLDGRPAPIGGRAFDVLLALIERPERLVTKNELLDLAWPGLVVEENNLQVQISTLRKLLGPRAIATVPGRGYRLTLQPDGAAVAPTPPPPAPAEEHAGNLPLRAPPLIGRDGVLRELLERIDAHALVTVVGAGGIGKTALALAAAVALRRQFRDGVWWVDLAPLAGPARLAQAVAQALRITVASAAKAPEQLVGALGSQQMLVVLDNCEHLVDAASRLAEVIGAAAPSVRVLATSQELLNVHGESVLRLEPLSFPAAGEAPQTQAHAAVGLFIERARAVDPHFALTTENATAVADICRRLDGLPLAIELAAARVRLLGVLGVRERLGERFKMLTGGARTALQRHQTLRATVDWSHALLQPDEQAVLRRLGVFVGGFSLELAQQVAADERIEEWAALDALGALVDKSLVMVDPGDPVRYRLLETTRAYALERLAEHGETARSLERHAHAMRDLFVRTDEERFGDDGALDMASLLQRLVPECENWRAAFDWAVGDATEPATAVALAGAGASMLRYLGLRQEALARMLPLRLLVNDDRNSSCAAAFWLGLASVGYNNRLPRDVLLDAAARAQRLYCAGRSRRRAHVAMCWSAWSLANVGEDAAAEALLPEIMGLEREDDPPWMRSQRLNVQASICRQHMRFDDLLSLHSEEQLLLLQAPGEVEALAGCRRNMASALNALQRHEEAIVLAQSALALAAGTSSRAFHEVMVAQTELGRLDEVWRTLREAVPVWRRDAALLDFCHGIAPLFAVSGRHADAARLDGAAMANLRRVGAPLVGTSTLLRERLIRAFEAAGVEPADIERWQREGEGLDEAKVAALCAAADALSSASRQGKPGKDSGVEDGPGEPHGS